MGNIIAVTVDENSVRPHELHVVTEASPLFLPSVTLLRSEGKKALLYACEGLTPLSDYGQRSDSFSLSLLFELLTGYIRSLFDARDMLLNTSLLSSDPEKGIFVLRDASAPAVSVRIKVLWGADEVAGEGEKICRVAGSLAKHERVMGARISMERMIGIIRSENLSLQDCLKAAESLCREWHHITPSHTSC